MDDQHHLKNLRAALDDADDSERAEVLSHPFIVGVRTAGQPVAQPAGVAALRAIATISCDVAGNPLDDKAIKHLALMAANSRATSWLVRALRLWSCYRVLRMVDRPTPEHPL